MGRSSPLDHVLDHRIRVMCGCDLGVVGTSSILGLVRGSGVFDEVFPAFVLVSRMKLAQQYHRVWIVCSIIEFGLSSYRPSFKVLSLVLVFSIHNEQRLTLVLSIDNKPLFGTNILKS